MSDEPLLSGNIDVDNFNSRQLGQERLGTTLYLNSPTGVGDQLVTRLVTSGSRSNYAYLTYLRPVSSYGTRVGASIDYFNYDADALYNLGRIDGYASDARLYLTHPLIRSRYTNLNLRTDYSHFRVDDRRDFSGTQFAADRSLNLFSISLSGDETHDWLANGITLFDATVTAGNLDINGDALYQQGTPKPLANAQLQQPMMVPPQPQSQANQPVPQGTPKPLATAQLQQPMLVPPQPQSPANQPVPQGTPKPLANAQLQQPMLVPPQPQVSANQLVPQRTPNSPSTAQVPTTAFAVPSGGISVVPDNAHSHALLVHSPDTPKPVTSGRVAVEGLYSLEYIEPGLQNRKVKVYRTRDAAEQIYKDTIPLDRGGFQLIVVGTRNPDYVH